MPWRKFITVLAGLTSASGTALAHASWCWPIEVFALQLAELPAKDRQWRRCKATEQVEASCTCGANEFAAFSACKSDDPAVLTIFVYDVGRKRHHSIAATTYRLWSNGNGTPPEVGRTRWNAVHAFVGTTSVLSVASGTKGAQNRSGRTTERTVFDVTRLSVSDQFVSCTRDEALDDLRSYCGTDKPSVACVLEVK
jgi:hypothetical protein